MTGEGIRFTKVGEVHVAYMARGQGPRDILLLPGGVIPLDVMDDEPRLARFLTGLGRLGRVLLRPVGAGRSLNSAQATAPGAVHCAQNRALAERA